MTTKPSIGEKLQNGRFPWLGYIRPLSGLPARGDPCAGGGADSKTWSLGQAFSHVSGQSPRFLGGFRKADGFPHGLFFSPRWFSDVDISSV